VKTSQTTACCSCSCRVIITRCYIIDCGDPETINSVMRTYGFNDHRTGYKDDARKAIKEKCYHQGIIQSCSPCHKRNEDNTLLECEGT
jgi:hypothetical protein